jgi:hypothetical protein
MPSLPDTLAGDLAASDLQALLLGVYRRRAQAAQEPRVLSQAAKNALMKPSAVDARTLSLFDHIALQTGGHFEAIDLSPVVPLGTTHVLGGIDQNNVLTTIRNAEVLGDATPALALECAQRRRNPATRTAAAPVRLCATHRVVRLQPFDFPGFTPHFRLFSLVSAGRDTGSNTFEFAHLAEHIRFYLELCRALNANGFALGSPLVEISDLAVTAILLEEVGVSSDEVRAEVRAHKPGSSERFLEARGITLPDTGLCLRISPVAPHGARYPVIDGGFTDWTARLLQDRKERLLTSGIGSEFVCRHYRIGSPSS